MMATGRREGYRDDGGSTDGDITFFSYMPPRRGAAVIVLAFLLMDIGISVTVGFASPEAPPGGFDFQIFALFLIFMLALSVFPVGFLYAIFIASRELGRVELRATHGTLICRAGRSETSIPMENIAEIGCHLEPLMRYLRIRTKDGNVVDVGANALPGWVRKEELMERAVAVWDTVRRANPEVKLYLYAWPHIRTRGRWDGERWVTGLPRGNEM